MSRQYTRCGSGQRRGRPMSVFLCAPPPWEPTDRVFFSLCSPWEPTDRVSFSLCSPRVPADRVSFSLCSPVDCPGRTKRRRRRLSFFGSVFLDTGVHCRYLTLHSAFSFWTGLPIFKSFVHLFFCLSVEASSSCLTFCFCVLIRSPVDCALKQREEADRGKFFFSFGCHLLFRFLNTLFSFA